MTRGRLGAYAPRQLGDFMLGRGVLLALGIAFVFWSQIAVMRAGMGPAWADGPLGAARAQRIFDQLLGLLTWVGTIIAVRGIVSTDRRQGYFRFFFAKPVGLVRFYLQSWAMTGLGLTLLAALLAATFTVLASPVSIPGAVAAMLLVWWAIGGLGFLLSTLTDADGLMLMLLSVVGLAATEYARARQFALQEKLLWLEAARYLLPPIEPLREAREYLVGDGPLATASLVWILGFGLVCLAAGTFVLRRRPFGA